MVGRDRELLEIAEAIDHARHGRGALVLVVGEPGIGKSRLATEAATAARERGCAVAWGGCWEAGGAPAFWPWREVCEVLGAAWPSAGGVSASDPGEARFALFRAIAVALAEAAARRPALIVLEDLHAADYSTLLALDYLATRFQDSPILVLGTYRDLEARLRGDGAEIIGRLERRARVMHLSRLGADDVAALVRRSIADAAADVVAGVFETTQGNPLFVDEIVRDLRAHGARSGVPLGVREVIRQRLSPLSVETRAVLDAASVLGVELAAAELVRMAPGAETPIEDAIRQGVFVRQGERLRFAHALYREALYFDLAAPRRQALHAAAARAVAAIGASLSERAHHLLEAGPEEAGAAVDQAIRAAAHAVDTFAFEDATVLLARARGAIPSGPDETALRCRVTIAHGETKIRSGDVSGRGACIEAAEAARALGDAELLAHAGLAYGAVFMTGGVDPVLVTILEQALEMLPAAPSSLRARVMARLAAARQPSPPAERMRDVELGIAAIAMAREVAEPRELLNVLHAASGVMYGVADPAVRINAMSEQERLAEQLGDTTRLLHARLRLAYDHLEQGDFTSYAQVVSRYEPLAARIGLAAGPWRVPLMRSMLALATDRFADAERWQAEARSLVGSDPRARRAETFHRIGALRAAERHRELRAAIPELRAAWLAMPYGVMLADAHVASLLARIGADDELATLIAGLSDAILDEEINAHVLAEAAWATADPALAARLLPILRRYATRWRVYWFDCEMVDAPGTRGLAYVEGVLGHWAECDRQFARALADVEAGGRRALAARMRFELGDLLVRKQCEPERARTLLTAAHAEASAAGLSELVASIERRHPALVARSERRAGHAGGFAMTLEGEYYAVAGTRGTLRFKTSRGMQYLAALVARPNTDVHVLELVGSADHVDRGDAGELADPTALRAYRARLGALRDELAAAEELGDVERAERARDEMETIAAELGRTTRKGGRARVADSAVDRARSAVQRRIKDALDRIADQDPELGAHLRRTVQTGNHCCYRPGP